MEKKLTLHQRIAAVLLILLVYLCGRWCLQDCFGLNTCGYSDASMVRYLEDDSIGGWGWTVLKTAREGWARAALCEKWDAPGDRYIIFFERRLFGLRWTKRSESPFPAEGLALSGTWNSRNSDLSSRCAAAVYGDNRTGTVEGYASGDAPEVHRANLEADYILDLYILDGIEDLPRELQTFEN